MPASEAPVRRWFEVERKHTETEVVEVELPAYSEHVIDEDDYTTTIYRRTNPDLTSLVITLTDSRNRADGVQLEVERLQVIPANASGYLLGLSPAHASTRERFEAALAKAREHLRDAGF